MIKIQIGHDSIATEAPEWFGLVSSLISSLAWPLVALLIAFWFKEPISTLLSKINKVSFGGASAEIENMLKSAEKQALEEPASEQGRSDYADPAALNILSLPPEAIVMLEWRQLEKLTAQLIASRDEEILHRMSPMAQLNRLKTKGLPATTIDIISSLRKIRNEVTHGGDINLAEALRFYDLSQQVQGTIRRALEAPE